MAFRPLDSAYSFRMVRAPPPVGRRSPASDWPRHPCAQGPSGGRAHGPGNEIPAGPNAPGDSRTRPLRRRDRTRRAARNVTASADGLRSRLSAATASGLMIPSVNETPRSSSTRGLAAAEQPPYGGAGRSPAEHPPRPGTLHVGWSAGGRRRPPSGLRDAEDTPRHRIAHEQRVRVRWRPPGRRWSPVDVARRELAEELPIGSIPTTCPASVTTGGRRRGPRARGPRRPACPRAEVPRPRRASGRAP